MNSPNPPTALLRACDYCRRRKIKCDRKLPNCGNCTARGRSCTRIDAKDAKRVKGLTKERRKRKDVQLPGCEKLVFDVISRDLTRRRDTDSKPMPCGQASSDRPTKRLRGGTKTYAGVLFLVRDWISVSFRRRSIDLLSKALVMASKFAFTMDEVMEDPNGVMSHLGGILYRRDEPPKKEDLVGPRITEKEVLTILRETVLRAHRKKPEWTFGKKTDNGYKRFFFSETFDRDFVADDTTDFVRRRPCWRPCFHDPESHKKVLKAIGSLYGHTHGCGDVPKVRKLRGLRAKRKDGHGEIVIDMTIGLYLKSTVESMLFFAASRSDETTATSAISAEPTPKPIMKTTATLLPSSAPDTLPYLAKAETPSDVDRLIFELFTQGKKYDE